MSHGGGGGGFGGHGGGYGGHGVGHGGGHISHSAHQGHSGAGGGHNGFSLTHALGLAQHHGGNIVGSVMHSLGIGHHGGVHHLTAHQPDQSPSWNQAMQGERGCGQFVRVDKRPFVVLFLLVTVSFGWLWLVYNVHHGESGKDHLDVADVQAQPASSEPQGEMAAPGNPMEAQGAYTPQAYGQMQSAAVQTYANQYMQSSTALGAQSAFGAAGAPAPEGANYRYSAGTSTMPGNVTGWQQPVAAAGSRYGRAGTSMAGAQPAYGGYVGGQNSYAGGQGPYGQLQSAMPSGYRLGGPAVYSPMQNGRARLVVNR